MPPRQPKGEYIETDTGNKVSRRALIHGTPSIILGGRTVIQADVILRGDLARTLPSSQPLPASLTTSSQSPVSIAIGRYSFFSVGCVLRPPAKLHRGVYSHHPLKIGDHCYFGRGCVVEAASVGHGCWVGEESVLGRMCILKEGVRVLEGSVVSPGMVVGVGMVVGGRPARVLGEVGPGWEGFDGRELWRGTG